MQFFIVFSFECWDALLINMKSGFIFSNSCTLTSVSITNFYGYVNGSILIQTSLVRWVPKLSRVINKSVNSLKCYYIDWSSI